MSRTLIPRERLADYGIPNSPSQLRRTEKNDPTFPKRFRPTAGRCFWVEEDVTTWVQKRLADKARRGVISNKPARGVTTPAIPSVRG